MLSECGSSTAPPSSRGSGQLPRAIRASGRPALFTILRCIRCTNQKAQLHPVGSTVSAGKAVEAPAIGEPSE
eukprot:575789-Pyramimonas_sp.AAC.1